MRATKTQEELYVSSPSGALNRVQIGLTLAGPVHTLPANWTRLVEDNPVLRSRFVLRPDGVESIAAPIKGEAVVRDLRGAENAETTIQQDCEDALHRARELSRPPLVELLIHTLADDHAHVALTFHHIALDGMSGFLLLHALLKGESTFPSALPMHEPSGDYWAHTLAGARFGRLPLDGTAAARTALPPAHHLESVVTPLEARARAWSVSPTEVLAAVLGKWHALLCRAPDGMVLVPSSGRHSKVPGIRKALGSFANTIPVVITDASAPIEAIVANRAVIEAARHDKLSFGEIGALSPLSLTDGQFVLAYLPFPTVAAGWTIERFFTWSTSTLDIGIQCWPHNQGIHMGWNFSPGRVSPSWIRQQARVVAQMLEAL